MTKIHETFSIKEATIYCTTRKTNALHKLSTLRLAHLARVQGREADIPGVQCNYMKYEIKHTCYKA